MVVFYNHEKRLNQPGDSDAYRDSYQYSIMSNSPIEVLLVLVLSLFLLGCNKTANPDDRLSAGVDLLPVSMDQLNNDRPLSHYISDYQLIKLEDTEAALVGVIDKLLMTESKFFILERFDNSQVTVFDKSGKFLFKVGNKGNGPGEFTIPYDMMLDEDDKVLRVLTVNKILTYSATDGSYIKSDPIEFPGVRMERKGEYYYFVSGQGGPRIVITDQSFNRLASFLETNVRNAVKPVESFHKNGEALLFHMTLNDTIYSFEGTNMTPQRIIDFGDKALSNKKLKGMPKAAQSQVQVLRKDFMQKYMAYMKVYDENGEFIYFTFMYKSAPYLVLHSKKSGQTVIKSPLESENDLTFEPNFTYLYRAVDDYFVGVVQYPNTIANNLETTVSTVANGPRQVRMNQVKAMLDTVNFNIANPIIVKLKFKDWTE